MLGKIGRRFSLQAPPEKSTWGPLLVCIAPHCCGKTSFIKGLGEKVLEINTEDAKGLYETVALSSVWNLWADSQSPSKQNPVNSQQIYGMKYDDFRSQVLSVIDSNVAETAVGVYFKAIEEILHTEGTKMTTASIDLFVPEAVADGRNISLTDLKKAIKTEASVLCWSSNTLASNEPSAFEDILTVASKYQRVVRFLRWGQELPRQSFSEIVKRNVMKFLRTGRLIPLNDLYRAYHQCEETFKSGPLSHVDLARMAGFTMDDMGRTSEIVSAGSSPRRPSAVDTTPWSKWSNYNVIQSQANLTPSSGGNGGAVESVSGGAGPRTVERKSSINALIEKLQSESSGKSNETGSSSGKSATFMSPTNSLKGRVNSVSQMVSSVESRRSSSGGGNTKTSPELSQSQQEEYDRKAALESDWKKAVEEAQRAAEKARLERVERKKSEELQALVNSRKNSMQSMDEQLKIEAELKMCEEMDEKVNSANRSRSILASPDSNSSAAGDSVLNTPSADADSSGLSVSVMSTGGVSAGLGVGAVGSAQNKTNRSLRSLFGELSPVEAEEGDNTTLFVNLTVIEEEEEVSAAAAIKEQEQGEEEVDQTNASVSFSAALEMERIDTATAKVAVSGAVNAAMAFSSAAPETSLNDTTTAVDVCGDRGDCSLEVGDCDTTGTTAASTSVSMVTLEERSEASTLLDMDSILINNTVAASPVPVVAPPAAVPMATATVITANKKESIEKVTSPSPFEVPLNVVDVSPPAPVAVSNTTTTATAAAAPPTAVPDILSPSLVLEKQLAEMKAARQAEKDRIQANKAKRLEGRTNRLAAASDAHNRSQESLQRVSPGSLSMRSSSGSSKQEGSSVRGVIVNTLSGSADSRDETVAVRGGMVLGPVNLNAELEPEAASTVSTGTTTVSEPVTPIPIVKEEEEKAPTVVMEPVAATMSESHAQHHDHIAKETREVELSLEAYASIQPAPIATQDAVPSAVAPDTAVEPKSSMPEDTGTPISETVAADTKLSIAATEPELNNNEVTPVKVKKSKKSKASAQQTPPPPADEVPMSPIVGFFHQISALLTPSSTQAESSGTSRRPTAEDREQQDILLRSAEHADYVDGGIGHSTPKNDDSQNTFFRFACVVPTFPMN